MVFILIMMMMMIKMMQCSKHFINAHHLILKNALCNGYYIILILQMGQQTQCCYIILYQVTELVSNTPTQAGSRGDASHDSSQLPFKGFKVRNDINTGFLLKKNHPVC